MLDTLHYEDFATHLNTKFHAQIGQDRMMEVELIRVENRHPSPQRELFVLTFRAPQDAPAAQQLFQLSHHSLGQGIMFLVPIARDESGLFYEAVFNRNREA